MVIVHDGGHRAQELATGVLILPQRNPVVLAKEVATFDVLSNGRVVKQPIWLWSLPEDRPVSGTSI